LLSILNYPFHKEGTRLFYSVWFYSPVLLLSDYYYIVLVYRATSNWCFWDIVIILQFFKKSQKNFFLTNENKYYFVDGKVVVIEEVYEGEYYKDKRLQSLFMSPINVHVTVMQLAELWNSIPSWEIFWSHGIREAEWRKRTNYHRHLKTIRLGLSYRQVAGALARRIMELCWRRNAGCQGTDAGFINLVQVDLFYLSELQSTLCLIKKAVGRKTIIATKHNDWIRH
jgi:phosphatidylserine decarboxylase